VKLGSMTRASIVAVAFGVAGFGIAGCGPVYLPGVFDTNMMPTAPLRVASPGTYVGADVGQSVGFNSNESNTIFRGHVAWGTQGTAWRTSIDGFFYGGEYNVRWTGDSSERGEKKYWGLGAMFDANVAHQGAKASIGIGMNAGLAVEGGPYAAIWQRGRMPLAPLLGIYSFLGLHFSDRSSLELQAHLAVLGMHSMNLGVNIDRFRVWGGVGITTASEGDVFAGFQRVQMGASMRLE
jgi:hypothetical protein